MDKTQHTIRQLLAALPASGYDIGVLTDGGMYRVEAAPASRILRMLPFLRHRNAQGAHIYLRPTGESCYTLLDDLTAATLSRLTAEGYAPAAVVETSPGSSQAWLRHPQPFPKELGTLAAKLLPSSSAQIAAPPIGEGSVVPPASPIVSRSTATRRAFTPSPVTLSRFRSSSNYHGRPAAADMAFCIAAVAQGWSESDIAAALSRDYLSRNASRSRQAAYIRRTLSKALLWAA